MDKEFPEFDVSNEYLDEIYRLAKERTTPPDSAEVPNSGEGKKPTMPAHLTGAQVVEWMKANGFRWSDGRGNNIWPVYPEWFIETNMVVIREPGTTWAIPYLDIDGIEWVDRDDRNRTRNLPVGSVGVQTSSNSWGSEIFDQGVIIHRKGTLPPFAHNATKDIHNLLVLMFTNYYRSNT